jgi:exosortase
MIHRRSKNVPFLALCAALLAVFMVGYSNFFKSLAAIWEGDVEFSYGIMIPPIVAYLLWIRRDQFRHVNKEAWVPGLAVTFFGCLLLILANFSSSLILGGISLSVSIMGLVGYLWGRESFRIASLPLSVLILMAPVPSFILGELSWHLKVQSSSISSMILRDMGIPVYQDGNLLRLPGYILEVREACSGTRSLFALITLAVVLSIAQEQRWWNKVLLTAVAPLLAISGNVTRIVGTGLVAWHHGDLAANESLHSAWGVAVFLGVVGLLVGFQRLLVWRKIESA